MSRNGGDLAGTEDITPLMRAICNGDEDQMKLEPANGADMHQKSNYHGYTALMFAACCGRTAYIKHMVGEDKRSKLESLL